MVMAKWGEHKWVVTKHQIKPIENLSYAMEYDTEKKENKKKSLSLDFNLYREFGTNIKKEIESWKKSLGKSNSLYVGKNKVVDCKLELKAVNVSDVKIVENGAIRAAKISLSFVEL